MEQENEGLRDEIPPLLNPSVLEHLFRIIPMADLPAARSVCTVWKTLSETRWKKIATIKLKKSRDPDGNKLINNEKNFRILWKDLFQNQKPFRRMELINWNFQIDMDKCNERVLFKRGNDDYVTHLTLRHCSFKEPATFFKLIINHFPRLHHLKLIKCNFNFQPNQEYQANQEDQHQQDDQANQDDQPMMDDDEEQVLLPVIYGEHIHIRELELTGANNQEWRIETHNISYLEILSHFTGITSIKVNSDFNAPEMLTLLDAVERIRAVAPTKAPLFKIGLENYVRNHIVLPKLLELGIRLERFYISPRLSDEKVKELMLYHQNEIRVLRLFTTIDASPRPQCPPLFNITLPRLEYIRMTENCCSSLQFLENVPNLEKIKISSNKGDRSERMSLIVSNVPDDAMKNVKLLKCSHLFLHYPLKNKDLLRLVEWLPNIQLLVMPLDEGTFPIICVNWKRLIEVKCLGSKLNNKAITGKSDDEDVPKRAPNITSLKELETFTAPDVPLTESAVLNGFLLMDRLTKLYFKGIEEINPDALTELQNRNVLLSP